MNAPERAEHSPGGGSGTLYLVATPIGNLEDLSPRAVRILSQATLILAEDTRVTRKLCARFGIATPLRSFHDHTERERLADVIERLSEGQDVALVSDAGTPLISDPGFLLVREAARQGLRVVPVPGPSSVMAALSAAGLPTDRFAFLGYFPRREAECRRLIEEAPTMTLVLFETPHRIEATLGRLAVLDPDRIVVLARELTKVHEEILRGTASQILARLREPRGEMVLVLAPREPRAAPFEMQTDLRAAYEADLARGTSRGEALRKLSRATGLPRREIYRVLGLSGPGRPA